MATETTNSVETYRIPQSLIWWLRFCTAGFVGFAILFPFLPDAPEYPLAEDPKTKLTFVLISCCILLTLAALTYWFTTRLRFYDISIDDVGIWHTAKGNEHSFIPFSKIATAQVRKVLQQVDLLDDEGKKLISVSLQLQNVRRLLQVISSRTQESTAE